MHQLTAMSVRPPQLEAQGWAVGINPNRPCERAAQRTEDDVVPRQIGSWLSRGGVARPNSIRFKAVSVHHSSMNVTSNVTRYSLILPFSTLPFIESTSNPVTPRNVLVARFKPSSAASWKLFADAAVILLTLATAIYISSSGHRI